MLSPPFSTELVVMLATPSQATQRKHCVRTARAGDEEHDTTYIRLASRLMWSRPAAYITWRGPAAALGARASERGAAAAGPHREADRERTVRLQSREGTGLSTGCMSTCLLCCRAPRVSAGLGTTPLPSKVPPLRRSRCVAVWTAAGRRRTGS